MHPAVLEDHCPVQVNGDGNCFYRALSRALYGHEDCHLLLRLLIALEIGEYPRYYSYGKRSYVDLIKDFRIVLSDWHELMLMTATVGAYAGMQHFYAASAVLQMALYSYCPPSNNPEALSKPYTRIVRGRGVGASRQYEHIIMWSMMCPPKAIKDFMPNHFVVLSKSVPPCHDFVELTSHTPSDYPPLSPRANLVSLTPPAVKPCACRKEMARVDVVRCPCPPPVQPSGPSKGKKAKVEASRCPLVVEPSQKRMGYNSSAPFDPSLSPVQGDMSGLLHSSVSFGHSVSTPKKRINDATFLVQSSEVKLAGEENVAVGTHNQGQEEQDVGSEVGLSAEEEEKVSVAPHDQIQRQDELDIGSEVSLPGDEVETVVVAIHNQGQEESDQVGPEMSLSAEGGCALPEANTFMDADEVIAQILGCSSPLPCIPDGRKQSVFFLVDNSTNKVRRGQNVKCVFRDDCGAWNPGSSKTYHYVRTQKTYSSVSLKDGVYCKEGRGKKEQGQGTKATFTPLQPQPATEDVVSVRRYYSNLKESADYKRRVTSVDGHPVKCVEYIGEPPAHGRLHGNARVIMDPYVRTRGEVLEKIGEEVKHLHPRAAYQNLKVAGQVLDMPKDLQQVRNKKKHDRAKLRPEGEVARGKGLANDFVQLVNSMPDESFVKIIVIGNGKVPFYVLFTDDQIKDVNRFCCAGAGFQDTVLCVDKTYNLAELHVTICVFKHLGLVRRDTGTHPLFLGPVLIHGNSDADTFAMFFKAVERALKHRAVDPVFGSDAETALRQGFSSAFPNALQVSCVRHLRKNISDYLQNRVGCVSNIRNRVLEVIFGPLGQASGGLLRASSVVQYEVLCQQAEQLIQEIVPGFVHYFRETVKPILDNNHKCVLNRSVGPDWTNNNAESMNFILKLTQNWQSLSVTQLIRSVREIVKGLYVDAERALIGSGEFRLVPSLVHGFQRSSVLWAEKFSEERRSLHWNKFMNTRVLASDRPASTTTDGLLTVLRSASAGKKPGQQKRKRCAKTTTVAAKRLCFRDQPLPAVLETSD